MINKTKVFREELGWIVSPKIKAFAEALTECAPNYFFEVPASSTMKYHPPYALGEGGLVRHTKSCVKLMHEILELEMFNKYSQDQKDMMYTAMIAHDFFKHGLPESYSKYTIATHPLVCANYIRGNAELCEMLQPEQIDFICGCIASHMGAFNTDYRTKKEILPKPKTGPQNLVHLCDMLASRRWINIDFGDDYYEPESKEDEPASGDDVTKLDDIKAKTVKLCKEKIEGGLDSKDLYAMIAAENGGNRNPNSITDLAVAETVLHKLEEMDG